MLSREQILDLFSDLGDEIVHRGEAGTLDYQVSGSPYCGHLVDIGDRVIREAIAVALGLCGFAAAWRRGLSRASYYAYLRLTQPEPDERESSPEESDDTKGPS